MVDVDKDRYTIPPNRIREYRLKNGLTLEELADKVGISKSMLSYVELGQRLPDINIAFDIADALNTSVYTLWRRKTK